MNVFEAATATSGPAWRKRTASASRVIADPTVFVTAMIGQPRSRAQPGRGDRVGRLAGLGDRDHERPRVERRRAVAELRADGDAGRQPGPLLDGRRARRGPRRRRVPQATNSTRSTLAQGIAPCRPARRSGPSPPGRAGRRGDWRRACGLLVDLLEHEVVEAALLGGLRRPVHARHEPLARRPVDAGDRDAASGEGRPRRRPRGRSPGRCGPGSRPRRRRGTPRRRRARRRAGTFWRAPTSRSGSPRCMTATA